MITWLNTPFEDVIQATRNLYGDIACEIEWDNTLKELENVYGVTTFLQDGRVVITLDARTEVETQVETLGHEIAHVIVGHEMEHGEEWEEIFDNIFQEYNRYCKRKYSDDNQVKSTYKGCRGALELIADVAYDYDNAKTVKSLKALVDEIRQEALRALELGEGYKF